MVAPNSLRGVSVTGTLSPEYEGILTPECLSFVAHLARMFTPRVNELLARRQVFFTYTLAALHVTAWICQCCQRHPCMMSVCACNRL